MKSLLIYGAGDQGIVTLACALATKQYHRIDFLAFQDRPHRNVERHCIYEEGKRDIKHLLRLYDEVIVATGDNQLRKKKLALLTSLHANIITLIHPTAIIDPSVQLQPGSTILANTVINVNANIGTGCIINTGAIIEHDCHVKDYVNVCPKVAMAGHTSIGAMSYLGIGCTIKDEITIGDSVIIGAGAVVIHDIPSNHTAVGVPAVCIK